MLIKRVCLCRNCVCKCPIGKCDDCAVFMLLCRWFGFFFSIVFSILVDVLLCFVDDIYYSINFARCVVFVVKIYF